MEEYNNQIFPDCPERLRATLLHCGHSDISYHNYIWDGMRRGRDEVTIWQYTLSGEGAVRIGSVLHTVPPGSAMLLTVPEEHCYFLPESSDHWEFLYITLGGSEMLRLFCEFRRRNGAICEFASDSAVVDAAWDILHACRNRQIDDAYKSSAAAYNFMMAMCSSVSGSGITRDRALLKTVQAYCLQNISRTISVDELAGLTGCSRSHFSRRFQEASGYSPHEFILDLKIRKAVMLLQMSKSTIKEIAFSCGFGDVSYFCKVFRRSFGCPPGDFRDNTGAKASVRR